MNPSRCSMRLICVVAAVGLAAIPLLQVISYNNVAAQGGYFTQDVIVNINKGNYLLGNYGVYISNDMTGAKSTAFYVDDARSSQYVSVPGQIVALDGNQMSACVMQMDTEAIACDTQYANRYDNPLNFYIDMSTAQPVYPGGGGTNQFPPQ